MAERAQSLEVLAMRLEQLTEAQRNTTKQVDDIKTRLTLPPDGVFIKLNEFSNIADSLDEKVNEAHVEIDKLVKICELQMKQTLILETTTKDHEKLISKLHDSISLLADSVKPIAQDYDRRMGIKKWTDKILWALIAMMLVGAIPVFKTIFYDGVQKLDSRKVEQLEKKMKELEKLETQ
jgi:hypothetical protein